MNVLIKRESKVITYININYIIFKTMYYKTVPYNFLKVKNKCVAYLAVSP